MQNILIVYHSRLGSVQQMARLIARGVESVDGCNAVVRTVAELTTVDSTQDRSDAGTASDSLADITDIEDCAALIVGSPTRFGNMSAPMKYFIDSTSKIWMSGGLAGKPAAVFTSTSSMHGGQESTLLSMLNPLMHHGMLICGLPYTESALHKTTSGGTPYGASHVAGPSNTLAISEHEKSLCLALGKRVANTALLLSAGNKA